MGAALAVLGASALAASPGRLAPGEAGLFRAVNDGPDLPSELVTAVMAPGGTAGALALAVVALLARRAALAGRLALAWLLAWTPSTVLKAAVGRGRPPSLLADVALRQHLPSDNGYPSSHTAVAVALAVAAGARWPRARWVLLAGAAVVAGARVYVGVHLPLDLVGGAAVGLLAGWGAVAVGARLAARRRDPAVGAP